MLLLSKSDIKDIVGFGGVDARINKEEKRIDLIVNVYMSYGTYEYSIGRIYNRSGLYCLGIDKKGNRKEYKTTRGLINLLSREYPACISKIYIDNMLSELMKLESEENKGVIEEVERIAAPAAADKAPEAAAKEIIIIDEEIKVPAAEKESKTMKKRIDFKNKIELSMGEKVDLNVKLKRGQIEKVFIDETLKNEIYDHYMAISDKKRIYIGFSFFECKKRGQVISIELGKENIEIVPVFNMLSVKVTNKRGSEKIYYLNVEPKAIE